MSPPIPDLRPAPYVACHSFLPASMPLLILSIKSSLAPPVACLCAGSQRTQPQSWPLALTSLSRMGLPIRETCGTSETLGKSVHGNDLGKRSLFLSVSARTYLRKKKIHLYFSILLSPLANLLGAQYSTQHLCCAGVVKDTSAGLITASHAGNCVFGCGVWLIESRLK